MFNWEGAIEINGIRYDNTAKIPLNLNVSDGVNIKLFPLEKPCIEPKKAYKIESNERIITVKSYMTKKSTPDFNFMQKWNNDIPMPLKTMVGTIEKETKGMVYMKLHGDLYQKVTPRCLKCGKPITNPVSQYFGMGPECGNHNYVNPFNTEEELKEAVEKYRIEVLQNIKWEGWIVRSAIISETLIDEKVN